MLYTFGINGPLLDSRPATRKGGWVFIVFANAVIYRDYRITEWGLLPPIFKNTSNSFRVILPGEKLSQLSERQLKIWELLMDSGRITRKDVENMMITVPSQTINHDLRKMKEKGLIIQGGKSSSTFYTASF